MARPAGVQERWLPSNQMWREPRCNECRKLGHSSIQCPSKALFSEGRGAGRETTNRGEAVLFAAQVWSTGRWSQTLCWINGCTRTLVHDRLVPVGQKTKGSITICCGDGDEVTYPLWRFQ